jgi:hypothetical protein
LSVVLAVLWAVSAVWRAGWQTQQLYFGIGAGTVGVTHSSVGWTRSDPGLKGGRVRVPLQWWVNADRDWTNRWVWIPLWMPLVISLGVTAAAWRLEVLARRRARVGKCAACGYDRAGLKAGAVCPECGASGEREAREARGQGRD